MSGRYLIHTYGCQMNEHDSERIAGVLEADGYTLAESEADADVVIFNTCTIRENADNRLYGNLGHLASVKALRPDLRVVVAGCMAQKDGLLVRQRAPFVDVVLGTHNVHRTAELLRQAQVEGPLTEIWAEAEEFPSSMPVRRDEAWSAWVTVQTGCDNNCAFCIVPAVRGREISRPFAELVAEVRALARAGVVEVTLLGQNVNSYGRDLALEWRDRRHEAKAAYHCGESWDGRARPLFADLLRAVAAVDGIRRVRFTSPHPKDLRTETIAAMAEVPEVMPHLHLPVQSGSDAVLAAMHRGYTVERYLERLASARSAISDLAVTSDIIVGFPGETEDDFERTMQLAVEAQYDSAYTFQFSARPGTEAANMADRFVPEAVIAERFARLKVTLERTAWAAHRRRIGQIEETVVEGPSKKDSAIASGRTRHNKLIHFAGTFPVGTFCDVLVTDAAPHFLRGELVGVTSRPRHRQLIPVASN